MFKFVPENFEVRNFLKCKRGIKFDRAIHIAYGHADRFDGGRFRSNAAERDNYETKQQTLCHCAMTVVVAGGGDPGRIDCCDFVLPASAPPATDVIARSRSSNSGKRQLKMHRWLLWW